ncbi:MAG TPA: PQQ-binding-like beta-propeller repeat protein [Bryobacteraceae bacterium]|jgi:PQQ-dependent dehydrogenase (methanol/ethanol family)|nr:PQQ-binding-like beta-propeller repeat protein [Bryobacteraceae bacterium]
MSFRKPWLLILVPAFFAGSAFAQAQKTGRVDDATLRNAAQSKSGDWLSYGFTPQETRYSPLDQINTSNVSRLGLAWSVEVGPGGGGQEATPLVHNGVIFSTTQWSVVFAVDARTGKEKWRWDPEVNQSAVRSKICCGVVQRGVALYDGRIIAPAIDGRLFGLDEETGKPLWEARVAYPQDSYTITMAPRIAKGKAIIGVSGGEYPVRGFIAAFDAKTGVQAWKFYTVPGPGDKDPGLIKAAATWPKDIVGGGGGSVWDAISYDPELGLVYIGTGNAGPWSEDSRKSRGFDLLYAASIVAVDVNTGLYRWHYQNVPGDEWDFDSVQHLLLADVTIKGVKRKVLMQANKNGFLYTIDRTNGKFISATPIAKVNWALGVNEATGRPIVNPDAKYSETESANITPGPGGAHNWSPMSFNPTLGLLYVSGQSGGGFTYAVQPNFEYKPEGQNMGIVFGRGPGRGRGGRGAGDGRGGAPPAGRAGAGPAGENVSPEVAAARAAAAAAAAAASAPPAPAAPAAKLRPPLKSIGPDTNGGFLIAYDPATGTERWRVSGGSAIGGGTLATAGGIVFQATTGTLYAYSADKGEKLLELKVGIPGGMAPPITFMVDGKQYVALQVGQGRPGPGPGGNTPPPNPNAPPPVNPRLLVYSLDGTAKLP